MASQQPSTEMEIKLLNGIVELGGLNFPGTTKAAKELINFVFKNSKSTPVPRLSSEELKKNVEIIKNFQLSKEFIEENGLQDFLYQHKNILSLQVLQMLYDDYSVFNHKDFENKLAKQLNRAIRRRGDIDSDNEFMDRKMVHFIGDLYSSTDNVNNSERGTRNETSSRPTVKIDVDYDSKNFKIMYKDILVHESNSFYEIILVTYYFFVFAFWLPYPMTKLFNEFDKLMERQTRQEEQS